MTVSLEGAEASIVDVKRKFGLAEDEVDESFGLVNLDPQHNLYAILVDEAAASRLAGAPGVRGPYANPKIEPFGPPASGGAPPER
jgi:hypothetical protein